MVPNAIDLVGFSIDDVDELIESGKLTEIEKDTPKRSVSFSILEDYGILKEGKKNPYYFRKVKWGSFVKYDIRTWGESGKVPYKGITLSEDEVRSVYEAGKSFINEPMPEKCVMDCSSGKVKCRIMRQIITLKENTVKGDSWCKECNLVDWGYGTKLDIRSWKNKHERSGKGISLDASEVSMLMRLIVQNHLL